MPPKVPGVKPPSVPGATRPPTAAEQKHVKKMELLRKIQQAEQLPSTAPKVQASQGNLRRNGSQRNLSRVPTAASLASMYVPPPPEPEPIAITREIPVNTITEESKAISELLKKEQEPQPRFTISKNVNENNIFNNMVSNNVRPIQDTSYRTVKIIKQRDRDTKIPLTGNFYCVVDDNSDKNQIINFIYNDFEMAHDNNYSAIIIQHISSSRGNNIFKIKYKDFNTTSCEQERIEEETTINVTKYEFSQANKAKYKGGIPEFELASFNLKLKIIIKHFRAFILNKICRCIDFDIGLNPPDFRCLLNYDEINKYINFLNEHINLYIKLPENNTPFLHFYIILFLTKNLGNLRIERGNNRTRNYRFECKPEFIESIINCEPILKHVILICKRLLHYKHFNLIISQYNVSQRIYNYSKSILRAIINIICAPQAPNSRITEAVKNNIIRLIGFDLCNGELYLQIVKKILDINTNYIDFNQYIDEINRSNLKNKYKLYRKVIKELINYYFTNTISIPEITPPNYHGVVNRDLLKTPNYFKYNRDTLRHELCYDHNIRPPQPVRTQPRQPQPAQPPRPSLLNSYTLPVVPGGDEKKQFLDSIFSNPSPISEVRNNKLINDNILAKILYFYYLFNVQLDLNGKILNDSEKTFFIDILEYQFYLCHIIRKKIELDNRQPPIWSDAYPVGTSINDPIKYNFFKAGTILNVISPNSATVLRTFYNTLLVKGQLNIINVPDITFISNISETYKKYNVGKVIEYIRLPFDTTQLQALVNGATVNQFIQCYNALFQQLINPANRRTNYALLERIILNQDVFNNYKCLFTYEHFNTYVGLNPAVESNENKKIKLTNVFNLIPHLLFYFYKNIKNSIQPDSFNQDKFNTNDRDLNNLLIKILQFLDINVHILTIYGFIINDVETYIHEYRAVPANQSFNRVNPNIYNTIYSTNKIIYKTLEDLYKIVFQNNEIIERLRNGSEEYYQNCIELYRNINESRLQLLHIYENKNIRITQNNYFRSFIPNYTLEEKREAYDMIAREEGSIIRAINYLHTKPQRVNELRAPFVEKYKSILKSLEPMKLNVTNYKTFYNNKSTNVSILRRKFNNINLELNDPTKKYLNYYQRRFI